MYKMNETDQLLVDKLYERFKPVDNLYQLYVSEPDIFSKDEAQKINTRIKLSDSEIDKYFEEIDNLKKEIAPLYEKYFKANSIPKEEIAKSQINKELDLLKEKHCGKTTETTDGFLAKQELCDIYQLFYLKKYENYPKEELKKEQKLFEVLNFYAGWNKEDSEQNFEKLYYIAGKLNALTRLVDYDKYLFGDNQYFCENDTKESYQRYKAWIQEMKDTTPAKENYENYLKNTLYFCNQEALIDRIYREGKYTDSKGNIQTYYGLVDIEDNYFYRVIKDFKNGDFKKENLKSLHSIQLFETIKNLVVEEKKIYEERFYQIQNIKNEIKLSASKEKSKQIAQQKSHSFNNKPKSNGFGMEM
ncbi:hypothetical protein BKH41_04090 [Helicobacter sp. 12S02232-10]|uniref:hypothetical protein n=1 Tax=Helicobacter sp. 12S02232-10 TaxID=1476197 RepID=UPI000BA74CE7|nr:hypothetical protein [Helicobacter sp. 12S02232-10]PAF48816.1 hypothetical protein BKH41_04090 [Helicobacter sp. 12S02232-10]